MEISQAIILGIIQGLTEFLPISSSGHLVLVPWFLNWEDPGLSFDVALHLGTLVAVVGYFWRDWIGIFSSFFCKNETKKASNQQVYPRSLLWMILIATIPGIFAGYFLNEQAETFFRNPYLIAMALVVFGTLLFWADKRSRQTRTIKEISLKDSLIIGFAQSIAIIPGVSRSGITITAGLQQGLKRKEAARFSFLLSTPIIFGAAAYQSKDLITSGIGLVQIMGIVASAVSGYIAIFWLIRFVEKASYRVFFWYRLFIGFLIIGFSFFR